MEETKKQPAPKKPHAQKLDEQAAAQGKTPLQEALHGLIATRRIINYTVSKNGDGRQLTRNNIKTSAQFRSTRHELLATAMIDGKYPLPGTAEQPEDKVVLNVVLDFLKADPAERKNVCDAFDATLAMPALTQAALSGKANAR